MLICVADIDDNTATQTDPNYDPLTKWFEVHFSLLQAAGKLGLPMQFGTPESGTLPEGFRFDAARKQIIGIGQDQQPIEATKGFDHPRPLLQLTTSTAVAVNTDKQGSKRQREQGAQDAAGKRQRVSEDDLSTSRAQGAAAAAAAIVAKVFPGSVKGAASSSKQRLAGDTKDNARQARWQQSNVVAGPLLIKQHKEEDCCSGSDHGSQADATEPQAASARQQQQPAGIVRQQQAQHSKVAAIMHPRKRVLLIDDSDDEAGDAVEQSKHVAAGGQAATQQSTHPAVPGQRGGASTVQAAEDKAAKEKRQPSTKGGDPKSSTIMKQASVDAATQGGEGKYSALLALRAVGSSNGQQANGPKSNPPSSPRGAKPASKSSSLLKAAVAGSMAANQRLSPAQQKHGERVSNTNSRAQLPKADTSKDAKHTSYTKPAVGVSAVVGGNSAAGHERLSPGPPGATAAGRSQEPANAKGQQLIAAVRPPQPSRSPPPAPYAERVNTAKAGLLGPSSSIFRAANKPGDKSIKSSDEMLKPGSVKGEGHALHANAVPQKRASTQEGVPTPGKGLPSVLPGRNGVSGVNRHRTASPDVSGGTFNGKPPGFGADKGKRRDHSV